MTHYKLTVNDNLITNSFRHPMEKPKDTVGAKKSFVYNPAALFQIPDGPEELVSFKRNIAANGHDIGFNMRVQKCGDAALREVFPRSWAESNEAYGGMIGYFGLRPCRGSGGWCKSHARFGSITCGEYRYFKAWKNSGNGFTFADNPASFRCRILP